MRCLLVLESSWVAMGFGWREIDEVILKNLEVS